MNADSYFNDLRGGSAANFPRPLYRYNFYGWNFGGPVFIPHLVHGKNKLFFFVGQEYYSQLVPQATSMNIRVPTLLERTGDFSKSVDGAARRSPSPIPPRGRRFRGTSSPPTVFTPPARRS